ncbi:MAG: hypothetical protein IJ840_00255 [Bacteroidales bacterium]|nr:hypothetical protein [Bacteroidales bacterium]
MKRFIFIFVLCLSAATLRAEGSLIRIAASNSSEADKADAAFVCDGKTDCALINSLIDELASARGGKIVFLPGTYYVSALTEIERGGKTYKYGLFFPHKPGLVTLEGVGGARKATNLSFNSNHDGAEIVLTKELYDTFTEDDDISIIGSEPSWIYSLANYNIFDLSFIIPGYSKRMVVIDGKYASEMSVRNIFMVSGGDFDSCEGLNPRCVGIRACNGGNNGFNYFISHCKLIGLGTAFHIAGEHLIMEQCTAQRCLYGFVFGEIDDIDSIGQGSRNTTGIHNLTLVNCCTEHVRRALTFGGGQLNAVSIIDFNCEEGDEEVWYCDWIAKDVGGGRFRGYISYYLIDSVTWGTYQGNIWGDLRDGAGEWFRSENMIAPKTGPTEARPTKLVDIGFPYFDTDLGRMVYRTRTGWSE